VPLTGYAAFRQIVWAALVAGVISGVLMTLVQLVTTTPLIAQAEVYERRASQAQEEHHGDAQANAHHEGGHSDWEPEDGLERTVYTGLATILAAFGYALLLGAALSLTRTAGLRAGLAFGAAGFLVFQLAPALGLPPQPPGVPMAELLPRQVWWLGTVIATALTLVSWYFARTRSKRIWIPLGIVLIILPHVIGAPQAPAEASAVPEALVHRFSVLALVTGALFWLTLGALMGYLYRSRTVRPAEHGALRSA
jgi:cobalt transporter subunit CbtA